MQWKPDSTYTQIKPLIYTVSNVGNTKKTISIQYLCVFFQTLLFVCSCFRFVALKFGVCVHYIILSFDFNMLFSYSGISIGVYVVHHYIPIVFCFWLTSKPHKYEYNHITLHTWQMVNHFLSSEYRNVQCLSFHY